jgi:hypothetical protein
MTSALSIWVLGIFVVAVVIIVLWARRWKNAYVGINMGPCAYCRTFKGDHLHYLAPTTVIPRGNYASTQLECSVCRAYPGMQHIHTE